MTGTTLIRQRHEFNVFAGPSLQSETNPHSLSASFRRWGCPATNPSLRLILDRLVEVVLEASSQAEPGWIVEIGCQGGLWTEWIALTMKSCHTEPGATRLKLAVLDDSPTAIQSMVESLRFQCLAEPEAMRICHDGLFHLDQPADLVFSFDTLVHANLHLLKAYCASVARVLRPGGRFLVSLSCQTDHTKPASFKTEAAPPAVIWSKNELVFAPEIRETFERSFDCSRLDCQPVQLDQGQVFFEFKRLGQD